MHEIFLSVFSPLHQGTSPATLMDAKQYALILLLGLAFLITPIPPKKFVVVIDLIIMP